MRADTGVASRDRRTLWVASVLGGFGQSLAGVAGALLAREVTGSDAVAGLPQAMLVVGAAIAGPVLSGLARRGGRRRALTVGALTALAGCGVLVLAGVVGDLATILVGSVLLGSGNTTVMLGRYAAADLGPEAARPRAMASVLAATAIGAVAGPNLLGPATRVAAAVGLPGLTGPYLVAAVAFAAAAAALAGWFRPVAAGDPARGRPRAGGGWAAVGTAGVALGLLSLTNLVMVGAMTMAPVHLQHGGSSLTVVGLVVSLHIGAMFGPAPLTGRLAERVGAPRAAALAGAVLVGSTGLAAAGAASPVVLGAALVLLGLGWNLGVLAGSTLLTDGVPAAERPRLEGWGEVGMGAAAAGGGAAAGPVMSAGGYPSVAVAAAVLAAVTLPLAVRATRLRRRSPSRALP